MSEQQIASEIQNASGAVSQAQPDGLADSLIRVNGLSYRMPSNMSVVVARSMKRSYANLDQYQQNGKIIITLNTGSEYVLGPTSYLAFDLAVVGEAGVTATFESGSALNLIDNVTVTSQNGAEIDRVESVALYARNSDRGSYSQNYIDNFGSVIGYKTTESLANPLNTVSATKARYCIPLSKLTPLHKSNVLMPGMLAGGLRYEIKLNSAAKSFLKGPIPPTNYLLTNVSMMIDSFQLADSIQKRLMMESAKTGLEYHFVTYDRTRHNITNSNKAFVTVRKAVSRALSAFAISRKTDNLQSLDFDSVASESPNVVSRMFWRLGSLNFPNQPLTELAEQYIYAQKAFKKMEREHNDNSVSYNDFIADEGLVAVDLERSSVLSLSGLPVNNSRQLQLEVDYSSNANRDIDVFMHYLSLARIFPTNILMKE